MALTPFADDAASVSVGKLTFENGTDRVALYGSLDITRDQQGLAHARTWACHPAGYCAAVGGRKGVASRSAYRSQAKDGGQSVRIAKQPA